MRILNLYAGIGGNRKLWGDTHEITAVELNPEIAKIYQDFFPNDKMIVTDAHEYLLEHFKEYDFIWSSPPCQSHSKMRHFRTQTTQVKPHKIIYPDLKLYEEVILLKTYSENIFVIENVMGYYKPLIEPQKAGRHYFWSNFTIKDFKIKHIKNIKHRKVSDYNKYGFDISKYKIKHRKDQIMRNCIEPELGLHILNCAMGIYDYRKNKEQLSLL